MRKLWLLLVLGLTAGLHAADPWTITTIAGPHPNNGGAISGAQLYRPFSLALDEANNKLYIADRNTNQIRVLNLSTGTIDIFAGTNLGGYNGDSIAANTARLLYPFGVGFANGNVYIADSNNNRIRQVSGGTITTVAGNGTGSFGGDTGPATSAQLDAPWGVVVDSNGVIYIADSNNNRVRMVDTSGNIGTIAGTGTADYTGDNGQAVNATLNFPQKLALDGLHHLFIADYNNGALRQLDLVSGNITTIFNAAPGGLLEDVACDGNNVIYVATDTQVWTIDQSNANAVALLAGDGTSNPANSTDGVAANTGIWPTGLAVTSGGTVYMSEETYGRLRKISGGNITTLAGGTSGDGGSALTANFVRVIGMKADNAGNSYLADFHGNRIRKIDTAGNITTFAGTGVNGTNGDGGPATSAQLKEPADVVIDSQGNVFFSEVGAGDIRKVSVADGTISILASGLGDCYGLGIDTSDNIYASSFTRALVYKVQPDGTVTTFAGTTPGYGGDGNPATSAQLKQPEGVTVDTAGNVYIVDLGNVRVRKVDTSGNISTICGTGVAGYNGDNIAATSAKLNQPRSVAVDGAGRIFITDGGSGNNRIRKIENGTITTVVGGNGFGFAGDNGPASQASIDFPWGMSVNTAGTRLIFWDWNRFTCRKVTQVLAFDAAFTTNENIAKSGTLSANDGANNALTYSIVANPAKGHVSLNSATGAYTYTPNANATGSDSFTFKVNNGSQDSNTATVTITITTDTAPVANAGTLTTNEDTPFNGNLTATDADHDPLTYSIVTNGSKGSAVITNAATGAYTYTPNANANGTDSFTFKVNDSTLDSNVATISVTITAVNDAPVASEGTLTTNEDTAANGTLHATDVDSQNLTYAIVANGSKGSALITNAATGAYTYTPNANANGTDTFTFKANDGALDSNVATITVTINPVNDPPVLTSPASATPSIGVTTTAIAFTAATSDLDNDALTYAWNFGDGSQGAGASTSHTYANTGVYTATVTISDPSGASVSSSVQVTINPPGDADGDGFPDALEIALGVSPTDPTSTPFGGKPAGSVDPMATAKLTINLNFARAKSDSIALGGSLPVPAGFAPLGQSVVLDVGGVVRTFTLNKNGQAKTGNDAFTLSVGKGATNARFTAKITKASLAASLADEGLTNQTIQKAARTVRVIVLFNQTYFQGDENVTYTARAGKTGVAK